MQNNGKLVKGDNRRLMLKSWHCLRENGGRRGQVYELNLNEIQLAIKKTWRWTVYVYSSNDVFISIISVCDFWHK